MDILLDEVDCVLMTSVVASLIDTLEMAVLISVAEMVFW